MRTIALTAAALAAALCTGPALADPSPAAGDQAPAAEATRLHQLFEDFFEENLDRNPFLATLIGDPRYNDRLPNFLSPEAIASQRRFDERWLAQIHTIDRASLSGQDRLSYDIFVYNRETSLEGARFPAELLPIDQFSNFPAQFAQAGSGQSVVQFRTEKDYRDWLARIDAFIVLNDQVIANMKEGAARGITQPRVLMEKVLPQLEALAGGGAEASPFYMPVANFPDAISEPARSELKAAYTNAIETKLIPAYKKLLAYVRDEYVPKCRETIAISALPDGEAWYAFLVKTQTTTSMTPDEIHRFGLDEVARITGEMEKVKEEVGFKGDLHAFFEHLKTSDEFYYQDKESLLQGYRDLQKRINALLPNAFDIFPEQDYVVKEVPAFLAQSSAGAFYQPGTPDGSRPGAFFVNTYNLHAMPKYGMETLSLHEAAPGHHFQVSIAQKLGELPKFRRFGGTTAYAEGWALYAESLGKEMGLFKDPYQYFGRLNDEMLRAMRLVVDTGMHAKGWSREKAIQYMLDHSSMAESDVIAEVERYIANPGQALAYKVGQRAISGLRAEAEREMGPKFDLKAFHRAVLSDGSLPLEVLQTKMKEWIATQKPL